MSPTSARAAHPRARRAWALLAVGALGAAGLYALAPGSAAAAAVPLCTDAAPTGGTSDGVTTLVFQAPAAATSTAVIPAGVESVTLDVCGAQGGNVSPKFGGRGGRVQTTLAVSSPVTLTVIRGVAGAPGAPGAAGGGGAATSPGAGSGGGYSGVFLGSTVSQGTALALGGGGGGSSSQGSGGAGGGGQGGPAPIVPGDAGAGGGGGTQTQGGAGGGTGDPLVTSPGQPGSALRGGDGVGSGGSASGAGGGGYYGGGSGGVTAQSIAGGGGGGSGFVAASGTSGTVMEPGVRFGDGVVVISYRTPVAPVFTSAPINQAMEEGTTVSAGVTISSVPAAAITVTPDQASPIGWATGANSVMFSVPGTTPPGTYRFVVKADNAAGSASQVETFIVIAKTSSSASPRTSPTASPGSPTATPSSTATATPSSGSGSSPSPSSTSVTCPAPAGGLPLHADTPTINATGLASVTVTGAHPGATVELQGYSQNHFGTAGFDNDPSPRDRVGTADGSGTITFDDLRPASNTRLRAREAGCPYTSAPTVVLNVRAQETLVVTRVGPRSYVFSGKSIPARPGGLIISLYRVVGTACAAGVEPRDCPGEVFLGQARASAVTGDYRIPIRFPAADQGVRDEFVVKTGRDAQNAPGRSNVRSLLIF